MYKFFKRILDLLIALIALIILSPIFVITMLVLSVTGEREIFYPQKRVGYKHKNFKMWKFATMIRDSEKIGNKEMTLRNDPRVTKVGRILRITKINELPQIFNVISGEMSIVGPRPEMPFIVAEYNSLHRKRLTMKPGITGLWQISIDRTLAIHENIDYDIYYVENFTILLDVIIIARTVIHGLLSMKTA